MGLFNALVWPALSFVLVPLSVYTLDVDLQKAYFKGVYDDAREVLAVRARYGQYLCRNG